MWLGPLVLVLGIAVWFLPEGIRWIFIPAAFGLMVLYVRAMNRRARRDVQ